MRTKIDEVNNKFNKRNKMKTKVQKEFEKRYKKWKKETDGINERLKKKDYVLTVYQTGDVVLSNGDQERQVLTRRYWVVCSLEEIPEYIEYMKKSFWECEEGLTKKEIKNYSFEKKKWGRNYDLVIEPLSKELEESYLDGVEKGFFESQRMIRDDDLN
jgi:hypothetical protein